MPVLNKFCRYLLLLLLLAPAPASAQQKAIQGIVTGEVSVDFDPSQIILLVEYPKGMVRFVSGTFSPQPLSASPLTTERTYLVAAKLSLNLSDQANLFDYTFLLIDEAGEQIKITPVARQNIATLRMSATTLESIRENIQKLEKQLAAKSGESSPRSGEIVELRKELASITALPSLVSLKLEIQQKQSELEQRENDIRFLRTVVQATRSRQEVDLFSELRSELADSLRNIASVTAKTERLQRRQVQSAETTIQNKMKLIRDTEGQNVQALAAQVLELRRQRRALELQMGVSEPGQRGDDF